MLYEILKEYVNITTGSTIYKNYGEEFYKQLHDFCGGKDNIKNKHLQSIKYIANTLDVPVDFIINLFSYEGVDDDAVI